MRIFVLMGSFVALISSGPAYSAVSEVSVQSPDRIIVLEHGGGCRKSSPPGKCCHAGSKPLHCH